MKIFGRNVGTEKSSTQKKTVTADQLRLPERIESFRRGSRWLNLNRQDIISGRYRIKLYRFLTDNIPVVSSCVWTWVRLAAANGQYRIVGKEGRSDDRPLALLQNMADRIYRSSAGTPSSETSMLTELATSLYRDGFSAVMTLLRKDASGIERIHLLDPANIETDSDSGRLQYVQGEKTVLSLEKPDIYFLSLGSSSDNSLGRSILQAVPFVSYIEQQLVDDMRRTSHNSGFHRLHVKLTPPERFGGEADQAYMARINQYFDATVDMVKSCDIDENPVTWDNVAIESVGPENSRSVTNSWFMQHRAMIEEIAAGTNLAPFLLGYSYGATTSWSSFKFDMVMRQVRSVQSDMSHLLEWIGNIELALSGHNLRCKYEFDNSFPYQATDRESVNASRLESIRKLYEAGLIDKEIARDKIGAVL